MINLKFINSLTGRLLVFGVLPAMLAIIAIVAVSTFDSRNDMFAAERRLLASSAHGAASELNFRNERWNNVATVMALAQSNGLFGKRRASVDMVAEVNKAFPLIIGSYVVYEPNADGLDAASLKSDDVPREVMDASGRFVPYSVEVSGAQQLRQRTGMDVMESYQRPKTEFAKTGVAAAVVTEPVIRDGQPIVTHAFPIIIQNKFVGTAGVDRDLKTVARIAGDIKSSLKGDVFILSGADRFIAATTDALITSGTGTLAMQEIRSTPFSALSASIRSSELGGQIFEAIDPVLGESCLYATSPVSTGGWIVVIRRTRADVMAAANATLIKNLVVGTIGVVLVGGLLYAVACSVSRRVRTAGIRLYSTATEINATSKQQEASASTFGAASSQIAAAVKEISATGKDLVVTMESVSENAVETANVATAGRAGLQGMESIMQDLEKATTSIADKLGTINERSQKITTVITTITKVADQTNILSINAAIEAEKAGEFGSGFLVIAREIRRLADQTASATLDIEQMVQQMQGSVSSGVMEMDRFADKVRRGVRDVSAAGTQLAEIIDRVNRSTESFKQVNESMQAQSEGAQQISDAMTSLSATAQQTMQSVREFGLASNDLQSAIDLLRQAVGDFKS